MSGKSWIVIIATVALACALYSGALSVCFEKIGWSSASEILKFDKKSKTLVTIERSFHNATDGMGKMLDAAFSDMGGRTFVHRCKKEPVFFGSMLIFFGVSACGVILIVHMIRTDSRFS